MPFVPNYIIQASICFLLEGFSVRTGRCSSSTFAKQKNVSNETPRKARGYAMDSVTRCENKKEPKFDNK